MADPAPAPAEDDSEEGLDFQYLKDLAQFLGKAPLRHRPTALVTFLVIAGLAFAAAAFLPRAYQVDVTILTQDNDALATLVNPNRPRTGDDGPTRAAEELIRRHDSVVAVVKDTNLLDVREARRAPILRLKDKLFGGAKVSETEKLEQLVALFEKNLTVTSNGTTIHLQLDWDDPELALLLINKTVDNFLEGRNAADVAVVAETITILEAEAKKAGDDVDAAMTEVLHLEHELHSATAPPIVPAPTATTTQTAAIKPTGVPTPMPTPQPKKPNLAALLAEKRRQIRELDEPRQRKIAEIKAQIADLKLTYAPAHPSVIAAEKKLADAQVEPPELTKLKQEEQALLDGSDDTPSEYDESAPPTTYVPKPNVPKPTPTIDVKPTPTKEDPPELVQAKGKVATAATKYNELLDRVDAARIELLTAQAAFKYRYSISQPAQMPKRPKKPNVLLLVVGGLFGGAILAILAAAARDLLSGRFIEAWQVKRRLKLPVLAQVRNR